MKKKLPHPPRRQNFAANTHSSFNLNPWVLAFCASMFVLLLQIIVSQHSAITALRQDNILHKQARDLESETIRDLMYELDQVRLSANLQHHRGYVSGVVDSVNKPDYYTDVWHSGYSRGAEVQKYVDTLDDKETQYTNPENEE
jgi:hypothetical protein